MQSFNLATTNLKMFRIYKAEDWKKNRCTCFEEDSNGQALVMTCRLHEKQTIYYAALTYPTP